MRAAIILTVIFILMIVAGAMFFWPPRQNESEFQPAKSDLIKIQSPKTGEDIQSPLKVRGQARGSWYFEAQFSVKLVDENGKVLAQEPARAQGEWMTENFVPFTAELKFDAPAGQKGSLILEKSNPSGLTEHDDRLVIPIKFPMPDFCAQVITRARNLTTGQEKDFPTPCDVPAGWEKISPGAAP